MRRRGRGEGGEGTKIPSSPGVLKRSGKIIEKKDSTQMSQSKRKKKQKIEDALKNEGNCSRGDLDRVVPHARNAENNPREFQRSGQRSIF